MAEFKFYNARVEYDGRPMGMYKPNKSTGELEFQPVNVFLFEKAARQAEKTKTQEARDGFMAGIQEIRDTTASQLKEEFEDGLPKDYETNQRAIKEMMLFCDEVIEALAGKDNLFKGK